MNRNHPYRAGRHHLGRDVLIGFVVLGLFTLAGHYPRVTLAVVLTLAAIILLISFAAWPASYVAYSVY